MPRAVLREEIMSKQVKVIVLRSAGTNCDEETVFAFKSFGASVDKVHINKLVKGEKKLLDYHILAIPGGFTYGDDIAAGRILANELKLKLVEDLYRFIDNGKLIVGICNGFQVLVKAGILPGPRKQESSFMDGFLQKATLMTNTSGKFEDRWTYLKLDGRCLWTNGMKEIVYFPVAHAEGKFVPLNDDILEELKRNEQIVFRYCDSDGRKAGYPENPNGSTDNIAGITDETGRILGLMPHPERHFLFTQHPCWTRSEHRSKFGGGAKIFENGVTYAREKLL